MDKDKKFEIYLDKSIVHNLTLSKYEFVAYCGIKALACNKLWSNGYCPVNSALVSYALTNESQSQTFLNHITEAIDNLIKKSVIVASDNYNGFKLIRYTSLSLDTVNKNFIILSFDNAIRIMQLNIHYKCNLLRYYCILLGTLNGSANMPKTSRGLPLIGNMSLQYLADQAGISFNTATTYNKILEQNHILHVIRLQDYFPQDKSSIFSNNVYGRYEDKALIEEFVDQNYKNGRSFTKASNKNRSLALKYHYLCKGKDYSPKEIQEIYHYVLARNKKIRNIRKQNSNSFEQSKLYDTAIFKKFSFLKNGTSI